MELTLDMLQRVTTGTVSITQEEGWFCFRRFSRTPEVYFPNNAGFQAKVHATASVTLDFITDARTLSFQYRANRASTRSLFFFDLYVDRVLVATRGQKDADVQLAGQFSWELPAGENRVTLYFPNLYDMQLKGISLTGASRILPPDYAHTIVCYGDSITQGCDAARPSLSYANRLAFALNAKIVNKGIGGDVFHPELIDDRNLGPDIVTVAYGTNDWSHSDRSTFLQNAETFLTRVRQFYPKAQLFVITPIWRCDRDRITACGRFREMAAALKTIGRNRSNVHVIDGLSLTAHVPEMLMDHVHPGELGHVIYGANLSMKIIEILNSAAACEGNTKG